MSAREEWARARFFSIVEFQLPKVRRGNVKWKTHCFYLALVCPHGWGTGTEAILCCPVSHRLYPRGRIGAKCSGGETGGGNRGRDICRFSKLRPERWRWDRGKGVEESMARANHPFILWESSIERFLKLFFRRLFICNVAV